jgi:recombination protein RecR
MAGLGIAIRGGLRAFSRPAAMPGDAPRFRPAAARILSGFTRPLARLIDQFERLPGIGPRTAQRLALHLLRQPSEQIHAFADALLAARSQVGQCQCCFHLSAEPVCEICRNETRRTGVLCVVADSRDLLALERTREFKGTYHVLGGLISPMDGVGPELLQIQPLVERVDRDGVIEVILALTPSVEGDTTSLYLARLLRPFTRVSRIAYGLPVGSELEYADEVTLARALEGRRPMD